MPGHLIVISAPSGSGKTTLARAIMKSFPSIVFSVSATTRPRRGTEVDGRDYYFLSREEFEKRIREGRLIEWEEIYGNLYGTLRSEVDRALENSLAMLFDVDIKGALSIKRQYPQAVLIFIRPPGIEALNQRLRARQTEDEATLRRRLERVPLELELGTRCDYQVVNDDLEKAIAEVEHIVMSRTNLEPIHSS
ncbi:MAG: guanylate kinase [Ignavibacteriales bacterium]|nr:guanylate kinase [Ignavibacteriales bacterium]